MDRDRTAVLVRITGKVQGVSFRMWARAEAIKLGLTGWVRNEKDGSVKALIVGPEEAVSTMLKRLRQGPSGAAVSGVVCEKANPDEWPETFSITG